MQVIYKYRILIGLVLIIGQTFLISIMITAREGMKTSSQTPDNKVSSQAESDNKNFGMTYTDSMRTKSSEYSTEEDAARKAGLLSIDF